MRDTALLIAGGEPRPLRSGGGHDRSGQRRHGDGHSQCQHRDPGEESLPIAPSGSGQRQQAESECGDQGPNDQRSSRAVAVHQLADRPESSDINAMNGRKAAPAATGL